MEPDIDLFFEILKTLISSYDASDGLYDADRHGVVGAFLNNSILEVHLQAKKVVFGKFNSCLTF